MRAVVRSSSEIRWSACRVGLNKYRSGAPESADLDTGILIGRLHFFEMPQDRTQYTVYSRTVRRVRRVGFIYRLIFPIFFIFRLVDQTRPSISWKVKSKSTISKCWPLVLLIGQLNLFAFGFLLLSWRWWPLWPWSGRLLLQTKQAGSFLWGFTCYGPFDGSMSPSCIENNTWAFLAIEVLL